MTTRWAPYAPAATVSHIIHHYRRRDVPDTLRVTDLIQIGVTQPLAPRCLTALTFLGLLDADGSTTEVFRALRMANDDEFAQVFHGVVHAAYKDIFDHVDPSEATLRAITNAFHPYSPGGQRSRMVSLFLGLCQEAGISVKEAPKQMPKRSGGSSAPTAAAPASEPRRKRGRPPTAPILPATARSMFAPPHDDPMIAALIRRLPAPGKPFPANDLDLWIAALKAAAPMVWAT